MGDCLDCGGTGRVSCGACDGRRFVAAAVAGGVARCPVCGGVGWSDCAGCRGTGRGDGPGPGPFAGDPLRAWKIAALGLLLVLVGWPALLFIDFALGVVLAHAI